MSPEEFKRLYMCTFEPDPRHTYQTRQTVLRYGAMYLRGCTAQSHTCHSLTEELGIAMSKLHKYYTLGVTLYVIALSLACYVASEVYA